MNTITHMNGLRPRAEELVGPVLKLPISTIIDIIHRRTTRSAKTTKMAAPAVWSTCHLTRKLSDGALGDLILHRSIPEPGTITHIMGTDLRHGKYRGPNITPDGVTMTNTMTIDRHQAEVRSTSRPTNTGSAPSGQHHVFSRPMKAVQKRRHISPPDLEEPNGTD